MSSNTKGLILGAFSSKSSVLKLTETSKSFDSSINGKLSEVLKEFNFDGNSGTTRYFHNLSPKYPVVVMTGLGTECADYCPREEINLKFDNIRCGIAKGSKVCKELKLTSVEVDHCDHPQVVGETVALISYQSDQWKSQTDTPKCQFTLSELSSQCDSKTLYEEGFCLGSAQTFAAQLAETPANLKAPRLLAKKIEESMPKSVTCHFRDKEWITNQKMNLFLSVNQGSVEPPILGEYHYKGADTPPVVLVGKGITFDSGGISLKPSASMADMKADMQGAACVVAAIRAIAELKLKLHVIGITPFTENLPSGSATKPGDVFVSMSGKTVEVDNTDAEGRLVLADALHYAHSFNPCQIIDLATLTGASGVALGVCASAIFTRSEDMLKGFKSSAVITGDRVWRLPLYSYYSKMVKSKVADLINCTKKREAGTCTAASFLGEFVKIDNWVHLDIACTMSGDSEYMCYVPTQMSGRPARTLIEYLKLQEKK